MTTPTKEYGPHPTSEIFSRYGMNAEELDALAADIKANGLKEPICLYEDQILDGNNRYRAGFKIGYRFKETDYWVFDPKVHGDPLAFVVSRNLHRRHLTESQRATIAATLVTTRLGYNQYNKSTVTNEQAAKMLGVSEATVKMAKTVAEKAAPEINKLVQNGELRLGAAAELLRTAKRNKIAKEQQVALLAKIKAEDEAKKAAKKTERTATKANVKSEPKANQAMKEVDDFKAKWQSFSDVQRRAFVMMLKDELAAILDDVRQQEAILGATSVKAA
jgi:ParB-like chromosome segregation protein Spo0J